LTSMLRHIGRTLHKEAGKLIEAMKALPPRKRPRASDLARLLVLYDGLRQRIESVPDVLGRLKTGKGEPVELEPLVQDVAKEYGQRYPKVTITFTPSGRDARVPGDTHLTQHAIRMVVSHAVM